MHFYNNAKLAIALCATLSSTLVAENKIISYESHRDKSDLQAVALTKTHDSSLRYLAYRDVPHFLSKYVSGGKAIDYGSGAGFSINFLQKEGFDVTGADVSESMIAQAKINAPDTPIHLVSNTLPFADNSFDLVFSGFVLFEIGSKEELLNYLKESKRVMKDEGIMIALTGSQFVFSGNWLDLKVDYPENRNLQSGDLAKSLLISSGVEFTDYYWTEADYLELFALAGLQVLEVHYPLGKESDPFDWHDEKETSPYVIFVASH